MKIVAPCRRLFLTTFILCLLACSGAATAAPRVANLAGTGVKGYTGDGGQASRAQINNPYGLTRGPDGALYFCDMDNHVVRKILPDGTISTVAGKGTRGYSGDGGPALAAQLNEPYEVRFNQAGDLHFVEMKNNLIRRVDHVTGIISTVAGTVAEGFSGDGGPAREATFRQPHSIQFDRGDNLYVCDIGNHRIRRVDAKSGLIATFAGTGQKLPTPDGAPLEGTALNGPRALDFDRAGDLWVALREGNAIYRIDMKARVLRHVAGSGKSGFTGNGGPAREATLSGPKGLSIAPTGDVYFADTESHSIRMIEQATGLLRLVAGTGARGDGPEGDPLNCRMSRPHGVFVEADGSILIGDSEAHRLRVVRQ